MNSIDLTTARNALAKNAQDFYKQFDELITSFKEISNSLVGTSNDTFFNNEIMTIIENATTKTRTKQDEVRSQVINILAKMDADIARLKIQEEAAKKEKEEFLEA